MPDIKGPYFDRAKGRWYIRWKDGEKTRDFSRNTKDEVLVKKAALEGKKRVPSAETDANLSPMPRSAIEDLPPFGTPKFFIKAFARAELTMRAAFNSGNRKALAEARQYIAGLKEISDGFIPHSGFLELEKRHERVLDYLESHGHMTRKEGAQELVPETPGLAEALGSATGPFSALGGHGPEISDQGRATRGESN